MLIFWGFLQFHLFSQTDIRFDDYFLDATLFGEYRTTDPARQGIKKTFHQTLLLPFPKSSILFVIEGRDPSRQNLLCPIFSTKIDPKDVNIIHHTPSPKNRVFTLLDPENIKWKHLLTPGIKIPTPWGQDEMENFLCLSALPEPCLFIECVGVIIF